MDDRIFTTSDSKNRYDDGLELRIVDKSCSEKHAEGKTMEACCNNETGFPVFFIFGFC